MMKTLRTVSEYLNQRDIRYVIVGGFAVIAHGNPRTTMDLDIIVQLEESGLVDFAEYLAARGFFSYPEEMAEAIRQRSHFSAIKKDSLFRLDIKGVYDENDRKTIENRQVREFNGMTISIASPEDTIANKLYNGSEQDIGDAESIYLRQAETMDLVYLAERCADLGVQREMNELKEGLHGMVGIDR